MQFCRIEPKNACVWSMEWNDYHNFITIQTCLSYCLNCFQFPNWPRVAELKRSFLWNATKADSLEATGEKLAETRYKRFYMCRMCKVNATAVANFVRSFLCNPMKTRRKWRAFTYIAFVWSTATFCRAFAVHKINKSRAHPREWINK